MQINIFSTQILAALAKLDWPNWTVLLLADIFSERQQQNQVPVVSCWVHRKCLLEACWKSFQWPVVRRYASGHIFSTSGWGATEGAADKPLIKHLAALLSVAPQQLVLQTCHDSIAIASVWNQWSSASWASQKCCHYSGMPHQQMALQTAIVLAADFWQLTPMIMMMLHSAQLFFTAVDAVSNTVCPCNRLPWWPIVDSTWARDQKLCSTSLQSASLCVRVCFYSLRSVVLERTINWNNTCCSDWLIDFHLCQPLLSH